MRKILVLMMMFSISSAVADGFGTRGGDENFIVPYGAVVDCKAEGISYPMRCGKEEGCAVVELCVGALPEN